MQRHLLTGIAGLLLLGCAAGEDPPALPELLPAGGAITVDGRPLSGAIVVFIPSTQSAGFAAMGVTNAEGKYELWTHARDDTRPGIPAGDYRVTVSRMVAPDGSVLLTELGQTPRPAAGARESVARQFSLPARTKLQASVASGLAAYNFEVSLVAESVGPDPTP